MASLTPPKKTLKKKGKSVSSLLKSGEGLKSAFKGFRLKNIFPYYSLFEAGIMAYHSLQDYFGVDERALNLPGSEELAAHFQKGKQVTTVPRHKFNQIFLRMADKQNRQGRREIQDPAGNIRSWDRIKRASDTLRDYKEEVHRKYAPRHFRIEDIKADITRLQTIARTRAGGDVRMRQLRQEMRELEALPSDLGTSESLERRMTSDERGRIDALQTELDSARAHRTASISGSVKGGLQDLGDFYREINDVDNDPHAIEMRRRWLERMSGQGQSLEDSIGRWNENLTREEWRDIIDMERNTSLEEAAQRGDAATVRDIEINYSNYQDEGSRMNRLAAEAEQTTMFDEADEDREDWLERTSAGRDTDDMRRANRRNPLADPYAGRERRAHGGRREADPLSESDQRILDEEMDQFDDRATDFLGYDPRDDE